MSEERPSPDLADLFVGAVTIGERGQVVIPAEAREAYGLRAGEKVLVFHDPKHVGLMIVRVQDVQRLLEHFQRVLEVAESIEADDGEGDAAPG
jgi:AbrB family looped-hinge helix DNA binding protein